MSRRFIKIPVAILARPDLTASTGEVPQLKESPVTEHRTRRAADALAQVSPARRIAQLELQTAAQLSELEALVKRIARADDYVRREIEADQSERADMHRAGMSNGLGMARRWAEAALKRAKGGAA